MAVLLLFFFLLVLNLFLFLRFFCHTVKMFCLLFVLFLAGSFFSFFYLSVADYNYYYCCCCLCGALSLVLFAAVYCYLCTVLVVVKLNSSIIHRLRINVFRCICLVCLLQVGERKRNRGRRLENDQITHIQIRNGKVKCQQNICMCLCVFTQCCKTWRLLL